MTEILCENLREIKYKREGDKDKYRFVCGYGGQNHSTTRILRSALQRRANLFATAKTTARWFGLLENHRKLSCFHPHIFYTRLSCVGSWGHKAGYNPGLGANALQGSQAFHIHIHPYGHQILYASIKKSGSFEIFFLSFDFIHLSNGFSSDIHCLSAPSVPYPCTSAVFIPCFYFLTLAAKIVTLVLSI